MAIKLIATDCMTEREWEVNWEIDSAPTEEFVTKALLLIDCYFDENACIERYQNEFDGDDEFDDLSDVIDFANQLFYKLRDAVAEAITTESDFREEFTDSLRNIAVNMAQTHGMEYARNYEMAFKALEWIDDYSKKVEQGNTNKAEDKYSMTLAVDLIRKYWQLFQDITVGLTDNKWISL